MVDAEEMYYHIDAKQLEQRLTRIPKRSSPYIYTVSRWIWIRLWNSPSSTAVVIEDACQAHGARYKGRRWLVRPRRRLLVLSR
jgi:dTDP-4-amino-4,6-dideoxygalactose transaminase